MIRRVTVGVGTLLVAWTLAAQMLAVVPVRWTSVLLNSFVLQQVILGIGMARDSLGTYNVLVAVVGVLCILWALHGTTRRRLRAWAVGAAVTGVALTVITTATLAAAVARTGAEFPWFAPLVPAGNVGESPTRTVVFGDPDGQELRADLYLPLGSGPAPVVVTVHGGGFTGGEPRPNAYSTFLAEHGYAVMDIEYRLASPTVHNWDQQVGDVGCALAWVGAHGHLYGLDRSRVAIFGRSAGGNLAINAAYMRAADTLVPTCGSAADMPAVRAVVVGYPAVDLTAAQHQSAIGEQVGDQYLGGTPQQVPDRYRFVDSRSHITSAAPPTLIYQGGADHLVRPEPVAEFAAQARAAGISLRYEQLPFLEHGAGDIAATVTPGVIAARHLLVEWLDKYVRPGEG